MLREDEMKTLTYYHSRNVDEVRYEDERHVSMHLHPLDRNVPTQFQWGSESKEAVNLSAAILYNFFVNVSRHSFSNAKALASALAPAFCHQFVAGFKDGWRLSSTVIDAWVTVVLSSASKYLRE